MPAVPTSTAQSSEWTTHPDACYKVLSARDARFDGRFFVGVTSTGIYCRPVCRVRVPKRENCRFFDFAAQAEGAGFRPCLRCRPELAPRSWSVQDASATLAQQALRLIDEPATWGDGVPTPERLAARLGVSDRHVRRIFEEQFGVSPLQALQTRRLLLAKQLLTDTNLDMPQVALASGFASVRRFNAAFMAHYHLNPTALRQAASSLAAPGKTLTPAAAACIQMRLGFRPPYDVPALMAFLSKRSTACVEVVDAAHARVGRTVDLQIGAQRHLGWLWAEFPLKSHQVHLQVSESLAPVLPQLIGRVRQWLDLDADPTAIHATLKEAFPAGEGLRMPGSLNGFELAVRAVLGQQITVAAARTLAQRLVNRFGEPCPTPFEGLTHVFPSAHRLREASADSLGELGIVKNRQAAILALAHATADGRILLQAGADLPSTLEALTALPGIGDWTAHYIAMRALRWPDAFPAGDIALHKALGLDRASWGSAKAARAAEERSQAWRPWRSYAVMRAWASL
ncbi:MAG: DNA-3-methyladenine-glycosylase II-like protein [Pseudomonadota bacterium]|jgi:AraC family transcriptional regulator, regulatory protein of adaptative response / DNA-3-methyladenine glycosylase II